MNGHIPHSLENLHFVDETKGEIVHYTCSAPSESRLKKYKIRSIGDEFGCANPREVLRIPIRLYNKFGFYNIDRISLILNLERFVELISKN